ncbi:MAG TPA: multifunctional 2',3'-cyclic-nucleotide 2'-phosphodiesterase/5'-nucleotidase/3'-nucleotidase [Firmicutes bacterium]|jgi:2',3'-cyclic-nucleotide 2'-phosphodiesterase (5'-nucleotidase family)|nr:multifunctional 2',3'-cyclic-nucleotide 2'-phosphodiesterase/5'-nucleotidase/3'-nucleotidase [Bacillota bacterium]
MLRIPKRSSLRLSTLVVALMILCVSSVCVAAAGEDEVVILYMNDIHGRLESFKAADSDALVGGVIKLATLVEDIVGEKAGNVIILNAGDALHGTNIVNLFEGTPMVEALGAIGVDAMAIGNHEFNYGQSVLLKRAEEANFTFLSANTIQADSRRVLFPGALILSVGGKRIGIFGLTPIDTPTVTHPKNVEGLEFLDPIRVSSWMVPYLRDQEKVDLVIGLTHIGYDDDRLLASKVPGIDIIVGGHSHTKLDKPEMVASTIIVQAGEHAQALGSLEVSYENGKVTDYAGALIPCGPEVVEDSRIGEIIRTYNKELEAKLSEVIGEAATALDGERANVRTRETNLGNLVADVMREAGAADIGLTNGGGLRASIGEGLITVGDVFTVLPFDNTLVVLEVAGADIRAALERSVSEYPNQLGAFLQVSGLSFEFDPAKAPGERVVSVLVDNKPLDEKKVYTVATNDFVAAGGDGYDMLKDCKVIFSSGEMLRDVFVRYIEQLDKVSPGIEGRIVAK